MQNGYLSCVKVIIIVFVLTACRFGNVFSQDAGDETWKVILALDAALVKKDSSQLKKLLADDCVGSIPSGKLFTKQAYISYHCRPGAGLVDLKQYPGGEALIRTYGDVGIVNRKVHATLKRPDGSLVEFDVQRIEVCVRNNNTWQLVSGQGTEINLSRRP